MIVSGFINAQLTPFMLSPHSLFSFSYGPVIVQFIYTLHSYDNNPLIPASLYSFICILCDLISAQPMVGLG